MIETQKIQILKSKRDALLDVGSLAFFVGVVYFAMNPDKYDRVTSAVTARVQKLEHWMSVVQTRLSIRSLPETDDAE
jgi:hypothetical protein